MVFTSTHSFEAFAVHYVLVFLQNVHVYWEESNFSSRYPRTKKTFPCSAIRKLLHLKHSLHKVLLSNVESDFDISSCAQKTVKSVDVFKL
jgi:hypothetical protein